jgi:hypothetical protein
MRLQCTEAGIELVAESPFEQDALARLHRARNVEVRPGASRDTGYPPDPRMTNVILVLPSPHDWGT